MAAGPQRRREMIPSWQAARQPHLGVLRLHEPPHAPQPQSDQASSRIADHHPPRISLWADLQHQGRPEVRPRPTCGPHPLPKGIHGKCQQTRSLSRAALHAGVDREQEKQAHGKRMPVLHPILGRARIGKQLEPHRRGSFPLLIHQLSLIRRQWKRR